MVATDNNFGCASMGTVLQATLVGWQANLVNMRKARQEFEGPG